MRVAITGADGFVGKNLRIRLSELGGFEIASITRQTSSNDVEAALAGADVVFHLAGVNRPDRPEEFDEGNADLTKRVCSILASAGRKAMIVLSSSIQAALDNPYGNSKSEAERAVLAYREATGATVHIFRLPNVFGKWAKPDYNSAVATFCYNIARGLPVFVNDPTAPLQLVHVDDVVSAFVSLVGDAASAGPTFAVGPVYETTVGALVETLTSYSKSRSSLTISAVGIGLGRALYSTYISYLPAQEFAYHVPRHEDSRGVFVEMLKTVDSGQFSYFSARPGVTRGDHYHHSKTEKFLVIQGSAQFRFRNIITGETHELATHGGEGRIVDTVPGWTHNITNVGENDLLVMLWANEIFDPQLPDTVGMKVDA